MCDIYAIHGIHAAGKAAVCHPPATALCPVCDVQGMPPSPYPHCPGVRSLWAVARCTLHAARRWAGRSPCQGRRGSGGGIPRGALGAALLFSFSFHGQPNPLAVAKGRAGPVAGRSKHRLVLLPLSLWINGTSWVLYWEHNCRR
jgi:hypothetical protein